MRVKAYLLIPLIAIAALLMASTVEAGDGKSGAKPPTPRKALLDAAKKLLKSKNYRAAVSIEGGISNSEDHSLSERSVTESYEGEIFGPLMHMPRQKAYRLTKRGVAYIDGAWRNILSDRGTARMERLFMFPEIVLKRALVHSRTARWLDEKSDGQDDGEESPESGKEERIEKKSDTKKSSSPTQARRTVEENKNEDMTAWPTVARIDVPPKEALKYFIEAQNSGCMSAG